MLLFPDIRKTAIFQFRTFASLLQPFPAKLLFPKASTEAASEASSKGSILLRESSRPR